jgi:hypothetical protein
MDVDPSVTRDAGVAWLANACRENVLFTMPMSNLPRFFLAATWTGSMKDLRDLQKKLAQEKRFARAVPNVLYTGYVFDTWRDALLMEWAGPKEPSA